jgi:hypothetical protein
MFGPLATRNSTGLPVRFTVTTTLIPSTLQPPDRPLSAGTVSMHVFDKALLNLDRSLAGEENPRR